MKNKLTDIAVASVFAVSTAAAGVAVAAGKNPTPQHVDEPVAASAPVKKPVKHEVDPLKKYSAKHDRRVIKDFGMNDIDGCSTRPAEVRIKEPGICGALERQTVRRLQKEAAPAPAPHKN